MDSDQDQNQNQATDFVQIKVKHSNGRSVSVPFIINNTLQDARQNLQSLRVMTTNDKFIHDGVAVEKSSERITLISQIINSNNEMYIGIAQGTPSDPTLDVPQRFNNMDANQKRMLLGERGVNATCGLTFKRDGSDINFTTTHKKLYKFPDGYSPSANNPREDVSYDEFIAFSEDVHSLQTSGVNATSVSLSSPWVSVEVAFENAKTKSSSSSNISSYQTQRLLHNKIYLLADTNRLVIEDEFANALKNAVTGRGLSLQAAVNVVNVLNLYGWYIPIEYTLGGAIYCTKTSNVSKVEQAYEERESFRAAFRAQVFSFGAGAEHRRENGKSTLDSSTVGTEHLIFSQIGGAYFTGTGDYTTWSRTLNDAQNWRIIEYTSLFPSLLLLRGHDNETLQTCMNLLRTYRNHRNVKSLQMFINIGHYELGIAEKVNPDYD